jgi:hypothetical protein
MGQACPIGHPSSNCSRPSTLNLEIPWRWASGKEGILCWYEYSINPIKPWLGYDTHSPQKTDGLVGQPQARNFPSWHMSMRLLMAHVPCCVPRRATRAMRHMPDPLIRTRPCNRMGRLWYQNVTPWPQGGRACYPSSLGSLEWPQH